MAEIDRFNFSQWQEAEIILEPSGKAPKHYGDGVYRFGASMVLSVIMPRRGWELIKKTDNYIYLRPPQPPPFILKIKIPNKKQAIELANYFYKEGETQHFQIGEWPGTYVHREEGRWHIMIPAQNGEPVKHIPTTTPRSWLTMGQYGIWKIDMKSFESDFDYHETAKFNTGGIPLSTYSLFDPPMSAPEPIPAEQLDNSLVPAPVNHSPLLEGREMSVEQNAYERNPIARKKCIDYYGNSCQLCGFNFNTNFGEIGKGFIHVHHINPISGKGGEYEVDPIKDLIPLCPNCHAMAHRKTPPYTIDELKLIILGRVNKDGGIG